MLDVCKLRAGVHINWDDFKPMYNLRFLKIYFSNQSGGVQPWKEYMTLENNFSVHKLRFLHWDAYPFTTLPTSISPDCLVELKLCYSKLKTLWRGTPVCIYALLFLSLHIFIFYFFYLPSCYYNISLCLCHILFRNL